MHFLTLHLDLKVSVSFFTILQINFKTIYLVILFWHKYVKEIVRRR